MDELTAIENVELPGLLAGRSPRAARARARERLCWTAQVAARRQESVPVSMMLPPKVRRPAIAAQSRGR
jgi:predicted ABC-type transport system involved in lysophospholipase L1 biosynthesis ATPase subunit